MYDPRKGREVISSSVTFYKNDTINIGETDPELYNSVLIELYDLIIADTDTVTDKEVAVTLVANKEATAILDREPEVPGNELIEVNTGITDKEGPGRSENEVEEAETLRVGDQESNADSDTDKEPEIYRSRRARRLAVQFEATNSTTEKIELPRIYTEAVTDPLYRANWKAAISEELIELEALGTWKSVQLLPGKQAVGCK